MATLRALIAIALYVTGLALLAVTLYRAFTERDDLRVYRPGFWGLACLSMAEWVGP